jgi:hypothetical protein
MARPDRLVPAAALVIVALFVVAGLALLARREPAPISQQATSRATGAALTAVEGGRVTDVETTTLDGATWEVDVITPDGTPVDVRLDDQFALLAIEAEADEHAGDGTAG